MNLFYKYETDDHEQWTYLNIHKIIVMRENVLINYMYSPRQRYLYIVISYLINKSY